MCQGRHVECHQHWGGAGLWAALRVWCASSPLSTAFLLLRCCNSLSVTGMAQDVVFVRKLGVPKVSLVRMPDSVVCSWVCLGVGRWMQPLQTVPMAHFSACGTFPRDESLISHVTVGYWGTAPSSHTCYGMAQWELQSMPGCLLDVLECKGLISWAQSRKYFWLNHKYMDK